MKRIKTLFRNMTDADFIIRNGKIIGYSIMSLCLICLVTLFALLQTNDVKTTKDTVKKTSVEKEQKEQKEIEVRQQNILNKNLDETFTFEGLTYKKPNTKELKDAFLNNTDRIIGTYKNYIVFATERDGLYVYNSKTGGKRSITDLAIDSRITDGYVIYTEVVEGISNDLIAYDLVTGEKTSLSSFTYNQTVSDVVKVGNVVYYILNENEKSYLQVVTLNPDVAINIQQVNITLPEGSFLKEENEKAYVINETGFYEVSDAVLEKLSDTPKGIYSDVKVWNGKPLIFLYNTVSTHSEINYNNQLVTQSENIFEMNPIDTQNILINDNNDLYLYNVNTKNKKVISGIAANSAVLEGNIIYSVAVNFNNQDEDSEDKDYYFFLEKENKK